MKSKLILSFRGGEHPELLRTEFCSPFHPCPIVGLRGTHFLTGVHPFKWGVTIHALSLFFTRAALIRFNPLTKSQPIISGLRGTPASSIDYALWQVNSLWISDLFGVDAGGRNYLQRIVTVLNSRQKDQRPVELYLNTTTLKPENITISVDSQIINSELELRLLAGRLERSWRPLYKKSVVQTEGVMDDPILTAA